MAGEERVGLEEEKGCEGTGGVGLEKGKGWRKRECVKGRGWSKRGVWLEEEWVCEREGLEEERVVRGCGGVGGREEV